jgi:hypothetical protein
LIKRIMLLLTVVAVMGMVAAPSAAAQDPPNQFCYDVGSGGFEEEGGPISTGPTCYDTMKQCEYARSLEPVQFGTTTSKCYSKAQSAIDSAGDTYPSMNDCRDQSIDPQSCRAHSAAQ